MSAPKGKKKIKRKKGKSKKYFTKETQDSIIEFKYSEDAAYKEDLYHKKIQPALEKLAENLIFINNYKSLHSSYEDLKADTVTFLYQQLPKFDETKGFLAFSYFNIIAKNFLTIQSKRRSKNLQRNISLDDPDGMVFSEEEALREYTTVQSPDDEIINDEFGGEILKLFTEIRSRLKNENEIKVMDCIICIFNNIGGVDLTNKRAVLLYIREMSDLNSKQLTTCMASLKRHFRELRISDEFGIF